MHGRPFNGVDTTAGDRRGGTGIGPALLVPLLIFGTVIPAVAQTPPRSGTREAPPSSADAVLLRELSLYRPEMAKHLEADLRSAGSDAARSRILDGYANSLQEEGYNYNKLPKSLRDKNYFKKAGEAMVIIREMDFRLPDIYKKYAERVQFEDEVVKRAGFKDYHELYSFLRRQYPDDLGTGYMKALKKLRDGGKADASAYRGQLDELYRRLQAFRVATGQSDSVLDEISPHSPASKSEQATPSTKADRPGACHQICDSQTDPQARAWCKAHCNDHVSP
jgi:hypothetical protein